MKIWVEIEDRATGEKLGDGPITTVTRWQSTPRLDASGEFSFEMPAGDPRAALVENRCLARCYGLVDGVVTDLGAGLVDRVERDISGEVPMLRVSGNDLLYELATRSVGSLSVKEQQWVYMNGSHGSLRRIGMWITSDGHHAYYEKDMAAACDGNPSTWAHSDGLEYHDGTEQSNYAYQYIGFDMPFDRVRFDFHTPQSAHTGTLRAQYYNGSGWADLAITDGTNFFRQDGDITWTRPTNWERCEPTRAAGSWFWVRLCPTGAQRYMGPYDLAEVQVYADQPTTGGLAQIMAYAPAGWSTSGGPTGKAVYLQFGDESVLQALIRLAESTGEHFRLGVGRTIEWLGTNWGSASVRAVRVDNGVAAEGNDDICLITELKQRRETSNIVSRVIPYGAGIGSERITLAHTTRSAPLNYTLSISGNYIRSDVAEAEYGRIEKPVQFQNILSQAAESQELTPEMASNTLFDAALTWLQRHDKPSEFYTLRLAKAPANLQPGQRIHVVYQQWLDGQRVIDIDTFATAAPLYILGVQQTIDSSGIRVVGLEVSTIERREDDDAGQVVNAIQDLHGVVSQGSGGGSGGSQAAPVQGSGLTVPYLNVQGDLTTRHVKPEVVWAYDLGGEQDRYRRVFAGELDSVVLAGDSLLAVGGWLKIAKGEGVLWAAATAGATTMDFGQAMTPGDMVVLKTPGKLEAVVVGSLVSGTVYNVTRNVNGGGTKDWPKGTPYAIRGQVANDDGWIELNATNEPRLSVWKQGATWNAETEELRLGDLNGGWGYGTPTWGLAVGRYASGQTNLTLDPTNGLRIRRYTDVRAQFNPDGSGTLANEHFRWDVNGNVVIDGQAVIGGWQIGTQTIAQADAVLSSAGYLQLGTGNNLVRLDAQNATWRLWAGDATAADAPFRIDKSGELWATNAHIAGEIDADSGHLGNLDVDGVITVGSVAPCLQLDGPNRRIVSSNYSSGLQGMMIGANGEAELNNVIIRGAIRSAVLEYAHVQAVGGGIIVVKHTGSLYADCTTVDSPTTFAVDIRDPDGVSHAEADDFWAVGDVIRLKDGIVGDCWATISSISDQTTFWRLNCVKQSPGAGTNYTFKAGLAVLNYGQDGGGGITLTAADQTPYLSIFTHEGEPWDTFTERVRIGNLKNSYGYASDIYGAGFGQYDINKPNIVVDGTYGIRIRQHATDVLVFDTSGNSYFAGPISLGTSGGIYQGTGSFASPTTGLKIWNDSGIGRIAGYNAGSLQWYANTDGKLYAGGGKVTLDSSGILIDYDTSNGLRFAGATSGTYSRIYDSSQVSGSGGLGLFSSTQYWGIYESGGAKLAMDGGSGGFLKLQPRSSATSVTMGMGNASNNWAMLTATNQSTLRVALGTGSTPPTQFTFYPVMASSALFAPRFTIVGVSVGAGYSNAIIGSNVAYAMFAFSVQNASTGAVIGHIIGELARPSSGWAYLCATSDRDYLYTTSGDYRAVLSYDGGFYVENYNTSVSVRFFGWAVYY